MPFKLSKPLFFALIGGFFILDRLLKVAVQIKEMSVTLIPYLLKLEFYPNHKGPFSLPIPQLVTITISIIILIILLFFLYHKPLFKLPIILIVAGAVSNLFDRIFFGYTIDTFNFLNFSFFNLADGLIFGGIILLILRLGVLPLGRKRSLENRPKGRTP